MEKKVLWLKSFSIVLVAVIAIGGALFYIGTGETEEPIGRGRVEAAVQENSGEGWPEPIAETPAKDLNYRRAQIAVAAVLESAVSEEKEDSSEPISEVERNNPSEEKAVDEASAVAKKPPIDEPAVAKAVEEPVIKQLSSQPTEAVSEIPSAAPSAVDENAAVKEEVTVKVESPVSYRWGASRSYTFRMEVRLTNSGSDTAQNVRVAVPMLENNSPYQTTSLKSVNYSAVSSSGRVTTFNVGDIAPGKSKTIIADFNINVKTVSINSSNETVEKARTAYEKYAGSGNCRTLARGFISECQAMGLKSREVVGFARPQRGAMTAGSLQGSRHSWAEFYVDGVGWIPVDLTFKYFGELPHTSHIIESYGDKSLQVNFTGGKLSASWSNAIL
ncbi:MAG: transglutaminase domain-containing protein [Bacillota bacterium]